jgi:HlyD family secretion protein
MRILKQFRGVVTSISNSASSALTADQVTNFKVKIRILKESYEDLLVGKPTTYSPFRPGMTATVDITKTKKNILAYLLVLLLLNRIPLLPKISRW